MPAPVAAALVDLFFPVVVFMPEVDISEPVATIREAERKRRRRTAAVRMGIVPFSPPGGPYLPIGLRDLCHPIFIEQNGAHPTLHVERAEGNRRQPRRPLRTRNEEVIIMAWQNFHAH